VIRSSSTYCEEHRVGPKISIIGAGSAVFSLRLIRDLCLAPGLRGSSVSLMDIDQERLDGVHALCRRYAEEVGAELDLSATTDRRASLDGADFVVVTALAAGHDRLRAGWAVAAEHGYRFGGSLHVMHDEAFWVNFYQYNSSPIRSSPPSPRCPGSIQTSRSSVSATGFTVSTIWPTVSVSTATASPSRSPVSTTTSG
jgi:hypothetical protein